MWHRFRYHGREYEWTITRLRRLHVRSVGGDYYVRCIILDYDAAGHPNHDTFSLIFAPTIIGSEFPIGKQLPDPPRDLGNHAEYVKHGIVHTELVRSLLGRWENRSRYHARRANKD